MGKRRQKGEPKYTEELDILGLISLLMSNKDHRNVKRSLGGMVEIQITKPAADRIEKLYKEGITFAAMSRSGYKPRTMGDTKQTYCEFRSFFNTQSVVGELFFNHAQGSEMQMLPLKEGGPLTKQLVVKMNAKKRPEYWLKGHVMLVHKILTSCL